LRQEGRPFFAVQRLAAKSETIFICREEGVNQLRPNQQAENARIVESLLRQ
jgi:hypothetical protein